MKHIIILALLTLTLTACMGGASGFPENCNDNEEICISIQVEEPVVYGELVTVSVTVTSSIDVDDLGVSLYFSPYGRIAVQDASTPEQAEEVGRDQQGIYWQANITNGQTLTFVTKLLLPPGDYKDDIIGSASTRQGQRVVISAVLWQHDQQVDVYHSGTPVPTSPGEIMIDPDTLSTMHAMRTLTVYSTQTVVPDQFDFQFSVTPSPYPPPYP